MNATGKDPLIIISGPTATGKTALAIDLSKALSNSNREFVVINFDSLLFYQELNIGTAKPSAQEMSEVPHLGVGVVSITQEFNASRFVEYATPKIAQIHAEGKIPILVGGSGFYIRALVKGMYESEAPSEEIRLHCEELLAKCGIEGVREELQKVDPESVIALHPNDHYRNIRALEHYLATGEALSKQKERFRENGPYDFSRSQHENWQIHHIYLDIPKEEHWEIIQKRTQNMIDGGLVQEVKALLENGFAPELKAFGSIGYKETLDFIAGRFSSEQEWSERISISTRGLAKAQRTFFKKVTPKHCYHPLKEAAQILSDAQAFLCKWPATC